MKGTIFAVALNHRSQTEAWLDAFQQPPYQTPPKTPVWFIKPRNTVNRMRVAQEEIFGPVACLMPFKDEAEGLRLANDVEYGLASYIWTQDVSKVLRLARSIEAGMVFVNTQNVRDLRQPFGGVKASGTGREGGEYSFEVFAEMKNVCISMGDHPIPKWGV